MKYCVNCGHRINEAGAYCPSCGANIHGYDNSLALLRHRASEDAEQAVKYAYWSFVGIAIPLIGWILAALSISKANRLQDSDYEPAIVRADKARITAFWSILLSGLVVVFWGWVTVTTLHKEQRIQQAQSTAAKQQKALQDCLNNADQIYDSQISSSTGAVQQLAQSDKHTAVDLCHSNYSQ